MDPLEHVEAAAAEAPKRFLCIKATAAAELRDVETVEMERAALVEKAAAKERPP